MEGIHHQIEKEQHTIFKTKPHHIFIAHNIMLL